MFALQAAAVGSLVGADGPEVVTRGFDRLAATAASTGPRGGTAGDRLTLFARPSLFDLPDSWVTVTEVSAATAEVVVTERAGTRHCQLLVADTADHTGYCPRQYRPPAMTAL